jgi:hypothetical protein
MPTFSEAILDEMNSIRGTIKGMSLGVDEIRKQAFESVGNLPAYKAEYQKYLDDLVDGSKNKEVETLNGTGNRQTDAEILKELNL